MGVPQGNVLGPSRYILYTSELPTFSQSIVATFADDTAILAIVDNTESTRLQHPISNLDSEDA